MDNVTSHRAGGTVRMRMLQASIAWTMGSLALAVGLHVTWLPAWTFTAFAALATWRAILSLRNTPLPSRGLRLVAVILIVIAVLAGFRTLNGMEAGTALLTLMAGLKLLETRAPRDHVVLLLLCYFLVLAAFLRAQYLWALPIYAASIWLTTAALLRATQAPETLQPGACLRLSGRMLLQATPLMLILFLLFPRVPGPFWALPKEDRASSGLSDTMSPGDISELTLSSDSVFRVRFNGPVPPPVQRYWRGPVLHEFDGYRWRAPRGAYVRGPVEFAGTGFDYSLMMEPTGSRWIFGLDLIESWQGRRLRQTFDFQLLAPDPLDEPRTFELRSRTRYIAAPATIGIVLERLDTKLPAERNLRSLALAQQLRAASANETAFITRVLAMFREQDFFYTLTPPRLDFNSVDDFLFNTRSGFCAHYASAFTTLMRAAGIPARVVTGYQGGEYNRMGGYYLVRQSDAHAWSEVWLAGRGWVRVDPTAAVAPQRIERGSMDALGEDAPIADRFIRSTPWLADIRFAWDALNTAWRERVLNFNARSQLNLLERLGIDDPDWRSLGFLLAASLALALFLLSVRLAYELKFRTADPVLRAYRRFCRRLKRDGLAREPHEGPLDFATRIRQSRPDLAAQTDAITRLYLDLRYGSLSIKAAADPADAVAAPNTSGAIAELHARVKRFRPKRRRVA